MSSSRQVRHDDVAGIGGGEQVSCSYMAQNQTSRLTVSRHPFVGSVRLGVGITNSRPAGALLWSGAAGDDSCPNPGCRHLRVFMFPHPDGEPVLGLEEFVGRSVAREVGLQFRLPPFTVVGWNRAVLRTTVPEAAVDEDGDALSRKHYVGSSPWDW
jgi:hypothetical protein